ncbi:MAG: M23 family metallopeptidase [Sulfurovum sp.]
MRYKKRKKSGMKIVNILLFLGLVGILVYIYQAPEFEQEAPIVESENHIFWNLITPLEIELSDNEGLKSFELIFSDGQNRLNVGEKKFEDIAKSKIIQIKYPKKSVLNPKATKLKLKVIVNDSSLWNFFQGNSSEKVIEIDVDYTSPNVNILANSFSIVKGGSALVVFKAEDKNLKSLYIEAGDKIFVPQPYKKKGYYASLIAWSFHQKSFNAKIVAIDKAKNRQITDIPFYLKNHNYKISNIRAKDKFIDGKIADLISSNPEYVDIDNRLERLKTINEVMRLKNEDLIHSLSRPVSTELLLSWKIKKFYPLKSSQKVASFGVKRYYYYETPKNRVSESYHVGYDLASTRMAVVRTSNSGKVVYANANGIYGMMPMIDHGLGLYTLYGHCSELLVNEGDEVKAGASIAKTGTSGLALGDHLHFGILVQGVEVRPIEWFDKRWIKKSIDNVFKSADKIIMAK